MTKETEGNESKPHTRVHIRMERSFQEFGHEQRADFLKDLAVVTGMRVSDIRDYVFKEGCVIFEGKLDAEAVQALIEYFERKAGADGSALPPDIKDFIDKHSVVEITSNFNIRIHARKAGPAAKPAVVFVHGWRGKDDSFEKLPEYLGDRLPCAILNYSYPTGLLSESPSLEFVARNLDNWVRNRTTGQNLAFVAHSMGGLVVRQLLVSQYIRKKRLDLDTRQVTLIASPNTGAALATLLGLIPGLTKKQLRQLSPDSEYLTDLNARWTYWQAEYTPKSCQVATVVGTRDKIVPPVSASGGNPEYAVITGADHRSIIKPKGPDEEIVLTLERFMRESDLLQAA